MKYGLIGKKREMTQIFAENGNVVPVTIVDVGKCVVVDSYEVGGKNKVLVGFGKKRNPTKAELGKYKKLGYVPDFVKEFNVGDNADVKIGEHPGLEIKEDEKVMVTGVSKGKGFQGVVKKFGFKGGPKTHGQSDRHRAPGSIGAGTTPGRVYKGKKMPGRMGGRTVTVKGLSVASVDPEKGLLAIKGAIPGNKGSYVIIRN